MSLDIVLDFSQPMPIQSCMWLIFNEELGYAGTFDALYWYEHPKDKTKSGLVIMDYKTNADLCKEFSRNTKKMLLPPFDYLYDEAKSYYILQLSLYQKAIEHLGYPIIARRLIWLKDDGKYELVPIENLSKELTNALKKQNNE